MSASRGFDFWQSTERLHCAGATLLLLFRTTCPFVVKTSTFYCVWGGEGYSVALPSKAQFSPRVWSHDNTFLCHCRQYESEIVSSGVVTSPTLSLFIASLFCSSQTLFRAFELLADMLVSRPSLWKATPQRLYWENRCSSFFLDVSMHLHFMKQSGYPKLFKLTRISKLPWSCNLFSERKIAGMWRFCNNCQELEQSKNGLF